MRPFEGLAPLRIGTTEALSPDSDTLRSSAIGIVSSYRSGPTITTTGIGAPTVTVGRRGKGTIFDSLGMESLIPPYADDTKSAVQRVEGTTKVSHGHPCQQAPRNVPITGSAGILGARTRMHPLCPTRQGFALSRARSQAQTKTNERRTFCWQLHLVHLARGAVKIGRAH